MSGTVIIGGELKHLKISRVPHGLAVRPILARVKKSLFDIITPRVADSLFLDLFAGSGSVGLEALSRGAKKVVFVEMNPKCRRWIEESLRKVRERNESFFQDRGAEVILRDVMKGLSHLNGPFDLIFSGAPYMRSGSLFEAPSRKNVLFVGGGNGSIHKVHRPERTDSQIFFIQGLLEMIDRDGAIKKNGWFIAQHQSKENFQAGPVWDFFRQEHYGDTSLSFFKYVGNN